MLLILMHLVSVTFINKKKANYKRDNAMFCYFRAKLNKCKKVRKNIIKVGYK